VTPNELQAAVRQRIISTAEPFYQDDAVLAMMQSTYRPRDLCKPFAEEIGREIR
jgi:hypothetical protein